MMVQTPTPERLADCTVAILGLGLMGGSLAMALRGFCRRLIGVDPDAGTLALARQLRLADELALTPDGNLAQADILVLAAPVCVIVELLPRLPDLHPGHPLVLDLGSTKVAILQSMAALPQRFDPLGGHPMTGKEHSSLMQAEAGLFQGAPFVLTALDRTSLQARSLAGQLVLAIGAHPLWLDAETHDRMVSAVSHVPFLAASALAGVTPPEAASIVGPGFRSTTRVAATPTAMMLDILETNRENVLDGLRSLRARLEELETAIEAGDEARLRSLLQEGAGRRAALVPENRS